MKKIYSVSLFLLVFILNSCNSGQEGSKDGIDLKLNFSAGDKYLYNNNINLKTTTMGFSMDQEIEMSIIYDVQSVQNDQLEVNVQYDHIKMITTHMMGTMKYDSKDPLNSDPSLRSIGNVIGKVFNITFSSNGEILEVKGMNELLDSFSSSVPEINQQFSDSSIRLMTQSSFDMYPGKRVKPGDSWIKRSKHVMGFSEVETSNNYKLKSINGDIVHLEVTTDMDMPLKDVMAAGQQVQMELSGKQTGNIELNKHTGQIIEGKMKQDIKGKMKMGGQEIPMDIQGNLKITGKKI